MPEESFRIVVLGDSVQWGQGLPEAQKFSELVRSQLQRELGRPAVLVHRYAHSGACIGHAGDGLDGQGEPTAGNYDPGSFLGELPSSVPTVHAQLSALLLDGTVAPASMDLVLLDGGINPDDAGSPDGSDPFDKVLNPLTHLDDLRSDTDKACSVRMRGLLERVVAGLPNARVVVTGYYPIFSPASSVLHAVPWLGAAVQAFPFFSLAEGVLRARLSELSAVWAEACATALRTAVAEVNAALGGPPRVGYAHVSFAPENCIFAPKAWLWGLDTFESQDPIAAERLRLCKEQGRSQDPFSIWASVGHPNLKGTVQYAQAVVRTCRELGVLPAVPSPAGWWARVREALNRIRGGGG